GTAASLRSRALTSYGNPRASAEIVVERRVWISRRPRAVPYRRRMRGLLVVNPRATATTARVRDVLARALGSDLKVDVPETQRRGHAIELGAQASDEAYDVVVVLGGDGTVNEVINGLLRNGPRTDQPALAVVPGGSTNVFSRALDIPRDP